MFGFDSLLELIDSRLGRKMDNCSECGKPTKSHIIGGRTVCHTCKVGGVVPMADGGVEREDGFSDFDWEHTTDSYPTGFDRSAWMCLDIVDDRKMPTGRPYSSAENTYSWSDTENWTDRDTALEYAEWDGFPAVAYILQAPEGSYAEWGDNYLLVDYDDAIDPETGEPYPEAVALMQRLGLTYTDFSFSHTGLHQIFTGTLPEGYRTISFDLPNGAGSIEIYDRKRVCVMTGKQVEGTPDEPQPIDENALALLAMFNEGAKSPRGKDGEEWEPSYSDEEIESTEKTGDFELLKDAIHRVTPRDIRLRSEKTEERSSGVLSFDPSWEQSASGTRLGFDGGWIYRNGGIGLDALQVVALEEHIITSVHDYPRGDDFWRAVDALRDRGARIPEWDPAEAHDSPGRDFLGEYEPGWLVPLHLSKRMVSATSGWDWRGADEPEIPQQSVFESVEDQIHEVFNYGDRALIDAPMASGKTYNSFQVLASRGDQMMYAATRTDQYEQAREMCDEHLLSHYTLPSAPRHCQTFQGEYGEEWESQVRDAYARGATPEAIHEYMNPPCVEEGCHYQARTDFDPDSYDVLIGHSSHLHLPQVVSGRNVVIDEFPGDAFRVKLPQSKLEPSINTFLNRYGRFPADDYVELMRRRKNPGFRDEVAEFFDDFEIEPDNEGVFAHDDYHAHTPHAVYTLVFAHPVGAANDGYPYERAMLPTADQQFGLFERGTEVTESSVTIETQPEDLNYARSVLALDGTPDLSMWERALAIKLNRRVVLPHVEQRQSYYEETLGLAVAQVSNNAKPYSSGKWVNVEKDRAVTERIKEETGKAPLVVAPLQAIKQYQEDDWVEDGIAKDMVNFGRMRGSNEWADESLVAIHGSPHYGNAWVQREAAFQNMDVYPEGHGNEQSFGDGDEIAKQMREKVILQTILRFARGENNSAGVFLNTSVVPEEINAVDAGAPVHTLSEDQRDIFRAAEELSGYQEQISPTDIYEHPNVSCSKRWVEKTMKWFLDQRLFAAKDMDGRRVVYTGWDEEPHNVTEHGVVELPPLDVPSAAGEGGTNDSFGEGGNSERRPSIIYERLFGVGRGAEGDATAAPADDGSEAVADGGGSPEIGPGPG